MKALKLLGIFVIILAVVLGLLYLTGMVGPSQKGGTDSDEFKSQSEAIDEEWRDTNWDTSLYKRWYYRLNQDEETLGQDGLSILTDKLNEYAIPKLHAAMLEEFSKPDCNKATIDSLTIGLNMILEKSPERKDNIQLIELLETKKLYEQALGMVSNGTFTFKTGWDGVDKWTPFSTHKSTLLRKRSDIQSNKYYKNIQNITMISEGLKKLEAKISKSLGSYRLQVENAIYSTYSKSYKDSFVSAKQKFEKQFGKSDKLNRLLR